MVNSSSTSARWVPIHCTFYKKMHARYEEWIGFIFDHPVPNPTWHWTSDAPAFEASGEDYAVLIEQTFTNSGRDLSRFSDAQVNQGIYFLASPGCSDYMFALTDSTVLMETRLSAIRSIFILYRDCFQARCSETLSHLDQVGRSALNPTCFEIPSERLRTYPENARIGYVN